MHDINPAFPSNIAFDSDNNIHIYADGMELRDYFAAKALTVELTRMISTFDDGVFDSWEDAQASAAMMSYSMADRMMYARTQTTIYRDGED